MGQQFTVTLPDDLADMVREKVASGEYKSADQVIGEALASTLDAPAHSEEELDEWLRTEVVPTIQRMRADPARGRTPEQVKASLEAADKRVIGGSA